MAQMTTVSKQKAESYSSYSVANFYKTELRKMGQVAKKHVTTSNKMANVSKVEDMGNGSVKCS